MINGVLGSCLLKSQSSFALSLKRAIPFIVPAPLQAQVLEQLGKGIDAPVPSRWTLNRWRVGLDASYSLEVAKLLQSLWPYSAYAMCDSSPMGKRNWLISLLLIIPDSKLLEVFRASVRLSTTPADDEATLRECTESIATHVVTHCLTPGAMGSRCEGLADKLLIFLFQLSFVAPGSVLNDILERFVSFCSDLGTEIGFADAEGPPLCQLAPLQPAMEEDAGAFGNGEPNPENPERIFESAMGIAGLDHIVANATKQMITDGLRFWKSFKAMLVDILGLFCFMWRRERFIVTCLRHGPGAAYEHLFKEDAPTVANWRWLTLLRVLSWLLKREWVLRRFSVTINGNH